MSASNSSTAAPGLAIDFVSPLWRQRDLLWQFIVRQVELRHKGSHLGLVWSFLNPLLMLGLYVFVFGYVFGGRFGEVAEESRAQYALGIFIGLSLFHLLAETIGLAPAVIVGNPNFVKKVVFPLEILPAATVGASFFHFLISMALALAGALVFGGGLGPGLIWLPVIALPMLLLALGLAWLLAALGVFFRDIAQITGFLSMALMFASAIFYPASAVPPAGWTILRFNPLIHAVEIARDALLWQVPIDLGALGYVYACGIAVCAFGYWTFRKLRPAFADVL